VGVAGGAGAAARVARAGRRHRAQPLGLLQALAAARAQGMTCLHLRYRPV
jgi:hypothetical protein